MKINMTRHALFRLLLAYVLSLACSSQCPALYRRYSQSHTFCLPPNTNCRIQQRGLSNQEKAQIVQLHNQYRSKIAMGQETIGSLPAASNMLQMEWDEELAAVAQKHADQCKFDHDCNECRSVQNFNTGQNLFTSWGGAFDKTADWRAAIKSWYDEVKYFNREVIKSFNPRSSSQQIGHFTQLVWAQSWKIGCGFTFYMEGPTPHKLYTCNYGPTGNVITNIIYEEGSPCSKCPKNTVCNKFANNRGLCRVAPGSRPEHPRKPGSYTFYCDFEKESNCNVGTALNKKPWNVIRTLSGTYASITLKGGESSGLNFTTPFKALPQMCVSITYRKGPNVAGQLAKNEAKEHFYFSKMKHNLEYALHTNLNMYTTFGMSLTFNSDLLFSISFSVPSGAPDQYMDVKDVFVKSGPC